MASSLAQQKAFAIAPKFTAAASMFGSLVILYLILRDKNRGTTSERKKQAYQRLILGMSCCDVLSSIAFFSSTWPMPKETGMYGAFGNQQACSAQGFLSQFALSTAMYNGSLAIYYVLVIVKRWSDEDILKVEPLLHLNPLIWGVGPAITSLMLGLYNPLGWNCWISSYPFGCQESWSSPDGTTTCMRGDNAILFQWFFLYIPLWIAILIVAALMYWVYRTVKRQEDKMNEYIRSSLHSSAGDHHHHHHRNNSTSSGIRRLSSAEISHHKRIRDQALCYVGAFLVTWFFPTTFQIVTVSTNTLPIPLLFVTALFIPIQGLLNCIVYMRVTFERYRDKHPEEFFVFAWFRMLGQELFDNTNNTNEDEPTNRRVTLLGQSSSLLRMLSSSRLVVRSSSTRNIQHNNKETDGTSNKRKKSSVIVESFKEESARKNDGSVDDYEANPIDMTLKTMVDEHDEDKIIEEKEFPIV